ncbi:hypothetical protein [Amycolatopsis albispora]|uniref:PH domain-containing protein n=1 Tax=Amycolatopsis albispora TaxID=1804986 RepID=A0A344L858_9PSEU|nr:hypothetical protein [Amycolatopsis albispora]AXB44232.1 hypothetical protein A4R43_18305 [Amycolatopsis albispora]
MSTMATIRMMADDRKRYSALKPPEPRARLLTAALLVVFAAIAVLCALTLGFWATVPPALVLPAVFGWYRGSRVALLVNAAGIRVGKEFAAWEDLTSVTVRPGPPGAVEAVVGEHTVLVDARHYRGDRLAEMVATHAPEHVRFSDTTGVASA